MKKLLSVVALLFVFGTAQAAPVNIPGFEALTEAEKAQIMLDAARKVEAKTQASVTPNDVQEWVNVGKSIGVGFGAAAEELGVGVDKLMSSNTGQIAMFLIVWNYIGEKILGVAAGVVWFLVMVPTWHYYMRRWIFAPEIQYHENGKKKLVTYHRHGSEEAIAYFTIAAIIILAVGFLLLFVG